MTDRIYAYRDAIPSIDIFEPSLPQPWIHYLSNGELHAFVSQAGGGFAWWKDAIARRLSRYRMHHLPADRPGFYLYIAEEGHKPFTPTYQPVCTKLDNWRCSFVPGKAIFNCEKDGLHAEQRQYITPDENLLVWDVQILNQTMIDRVLDLTAYVELSQLDWMNEQLYGYYWRHMLKTWQTDDGLLYYLYQYREANEYLPAPLVFFGSSEEMHSFSTDRTAFMGAYRDESNPKAIEHHACGNETILSGEPCFAIQVRREIKAGETIRLSWFLGIAKNGLKEFSNADRSARRMAALGRNSAWLDLQQEKLSHSWQSYLNKGSCCLPDEQLTRADLQMMRNLKLNEDVPEDFVLVYSGLDTFDIAYQWGITNCLDGMMSCTPRTSKALFDALAVGDRDKAAEHLNAIVSLRDLFVTHDLWPSYTAAMNMLGYEGSYGPDYVSVLPASEKNVIRDALVEMGEIMDKE